MNLKRLASKCMEIPLKVATATEPANLQTCRQKPSAGLAPTNTTFIDLISGLIQDGRLMLCQLMVRQQWLLVALYCLLLMPVAIGASTATIRYKQNGQITTCVIATCPKGYETVPCTVNGSMDTCSLCPPDKFQPVDNITSDLPLSCFQVHCAPDNQRPVHRGKPGPGNPPVCECDTSRNYYQHSSLKEDCRYKRCDKLEHLMLNGSCVCKEGRVRSDNGSCVWRQSESRSHAAGETTSTHLTQDTQSPTSNISNGANVVVSTLSPPAASSTPPTTATTTGASSPGMIALYIVLAIMVVLLVGAPVWYKVLEWRKRRNVQDIKDHGENDGLTSHEDSSGTSSTSSETIPPVIHINYNINNHNFVGNKSVQYGDHNVMVPQGAAEDEEKQSQI